MYAFIVFVLIRTGALAQSPKPVEDRSPSTKRTARKAVKNTAPKEDSTKIKPLSPNATAPANKTAIKSDSKREETTSKPKDPFGEDPQDAPVDSTKRLGHDSPVHRNTIVQKPRLVPKQGLSATSTPVTRYRRGYDAVITYDLCADENQEAIILSSKGISTGFKTNAKRVARKWMYLKSTDNVRMIVTGVNAGSYTLTLNTVGLVSEFDTANWKTQLASLVAPEKPDTSKKTDTTATAPPNATEDDIRISVKENNTTLANYTEALREARQMLLAQQCISKSSIESYLKADVPGTSLSRTELVAQQNQLIQMLTKSTDDSLKQVAKEELNQLDTELNQWGVLKAGTEVYGPVMTARDKDFVRFQLKKRFAGGTETVLPVIDVPVYGNFRINVSTGLLINRLMDYSYLAIDEKVFSGSATSALTNTTSATTTTSSTTTTATSSTSASSQKVPVLDDHGGASIGIGALIHCYYTTRFFKGNLTPALSFGASLNSSGRYTVMFGGSLILGPGQRAVLTAGYALGPVSRLQKPYKEGIPYEFSGAQFPTTTVTLGDWFFGLTWNLSSKRNPVPTN